jgi:hypothetical protein
MNLAFLFFSDVMEGHWQGVSLVNGLDIAFIQAASLSPCTIYPPTVQTFHGQQRNLVPSQDAAHRNVRPGLDAVLLLGDVAHEVLQLGPWYPFFVAPELVIPLR